MSLRVADFWYDLPDEHIATHAVEPRDAARMLVHHRAEDRSEHLTVRELPRFLRAGDLLVVNDTKVLPNRLVGRRDTGGRVEVLILERDGTRCRGYVKPARKLRVGRVIELEEGRLLLTPSEDLGAGLWRFELTDGDGRAPDAALDEVGRAPLPPYIRRDDAEDPALDRARYQTVYAREPGSVAAPTAGLHFTEELLARIEAAGVRRAHVTLHVGEGTFQAVRCERVEDHVMHDEVFELPQATVEAVAETRRLGGRVVAVGTTATRTLESCAVGDGLVRAATGRTDLFLYPGGRPFQVVDALFTNFHLPESTLLMLVAAFLGREKVLDLYREAVAREYRFYSFGDAMLLL